MPKRIDSHQHFWCLTKEFCRWPTPDLRNIFRDYAPEDLLPLLVESQVDQTILVQTAPHLDETLWLLDVAATNDFVAGVVGWVDLASDDVGVTLEHLAENTWLKGIRPMLHDIADKDWVLNVHLAPAFEALMKHNLCFDALIKPEHLSNVLALVQRYPGLRVIIDHGAKPDIAFRQIEPWAEQIGMIAEQTDVMCKLSGLLTEANPEDEVDTVLPFMSHLLDCFGTRRLVWGSDWPVLNLVSTYVSWLELTRDFLAPLSTEAQDDVLGRNASRFYQLDEYATSPNSILAVNNN